MHRGYRIAHQAFKARVLFVRGANGGDAQNKRPSGPPGLAGGRQGDERNDDRANVGGWVQREAGRPSRANGTKPGLWRLVERDDVRGGAARGKRHSGQQERENEVI